MANLNVLIEYKPNLYKDLFAHLLQHFEEVSILQNHSQEEKPDWHSVDVVVLSVDQQGEPDLETLPDFPAKAMLVAFPPCGSHGLLRKPGEENWIEVSPFGLDVLVKTVLENKHNGNGASSGD